MSWLRRQHGPDHTNGIPGRPLLRAVLRRAAVRYAEQGWDVVPGACQVGRRFHCGRPSCLTESCHPALPEWESQASSDPGRVRRWWSDLPYSILLPTGRMFDVIEVSAELGRLTMLGQLEASLRGPVAVGGDGRWMFLVRPGHPLRPELAGRPGLVLHGPGSWVPAPPGRQPGVGGSAVWRIAPKEPGWRLGDPAVVQLLLSRAVRMQLGSRPARARPAGDMVQRAA
ncbi:MAG TPA: bifunctional DNA primase/polymerase [Micromonosporaceae bacterium]|nr:bifunctional DNA primase/polymerase [Micromonosporaceae bacterium]